MKRSIAAKPIRDEPTTIKRCADDLACASVRECPLRTWSSLAADLASLYAWFFEMTG
jgi:hypothetical protein